MKLVIFFSYLTSTAKKEDIKLSVLKLLNRHNVIFGDYKWIEFDDCFLTNNVQSIAVVDTELTLKDRQVILLLIYFSIISCYQNVAYFMYY